MGRIGVYQYYYVGLLDNKYIYNYIDLPKRIETPDDIEQMRENIKLSYGSDKELILINWRLLRTEEVKVESEGDK